MKSCCFACETDVVVPCSVAQKETVLDEGEWRSPGVRGTAKGAVAERLFGASAELETHEHFSKRFQ